MTWWAPAQPLCIAHQGGAAEAPSSTMFAFATALANGADMFELDAHATADGRIVVLHDATVDSAADGRGRVDTLSLDDVRSLDAAYWFEPGAGVVHGRPPEAYTFRGVATGQRPPPDGFSTGDFTIPTLADVLERFPGVPVNIDIKETAPQTRPYEAALAEVVRRAGRTADVMVASFSHAALQQFRTLAPDVATSASPDEVLEFWSYAHGEGPAPDALAYQALQVPEHYGDVTVVTERFVCAAQEAGVAVHVWTVDDEASMRRLLDLGVNGIVTDRPTVLRSVLGSRRA